MPAALRLVSQNYGQRPPVPEMYAEDYEQLMSLQSLMIKNDEQSKLVKALKAALEEKLKENMPP